MTKFFYMNKFLLISNILFVFSVFSYKITLNPVLIKYFNFSETVLNYSSIFFSLGWFTGILIANQIFKYKFNFIKILRFLFIILFLSAIIEFTIINLNKIYPFMEYIYMISRFIEGFFTQILSTIILNLLSYKMVNNPKNGTINGFLNTLGYISKFLAPLIGSFLILEEFPLLNMIFYLLFTFSCFIIFNLNEKFLLREYHRYLLKKITKKKKKFYKLRIEFFKKCFNIINIYKVFFKDKNAKKMYFTITTFFNASVRTFYDFYAILFLIHVYNYSLKEATFIYSFMILGMSLHFISGYLSDKINYIYLYNMMCYFMFLLAIILYFLELNYILLIFIFLILGFLRSINGSWEHKIVMNEWRNFNVNLEEAKRILRLNVEIGTIIGYFINSIIFIYFSYYGVIFYVLVIYFILIIYNLYLRINNQNN